MYQGQVAAGHVIVDLRPVSPTYRNWESFELRDEEQTSLYVPVGCAHGFQALTDPAEGSWDTPRHLYASPE